MINFSKKKNKRIIETETVTKTVSGKTEEQTATTFLITPYNFIMQLIERIRQTIQKIKIQRIDSSNKLPFNKTDYAIVEKAITIKIEGIGQFTLMCTPNNIKKLAVGFLYTQGIIKNLEDINNLSQTKNIVTIILKNPKSLDNTSLVKATSGAISNSVNPEELTIAPTLFVSHNTLFSVMQALQIKQKLFKITGGAHAAAIFDANGKIIACCEDIGRHNALDKVIGECLLTKKNLHSCGVALSGRVSFEMVNKAAKAGIELIIAVSAPSSLAIQLSEQYNVTLCGFARDRNMNIYSHPMRIVFN